MLKPHEIRGNDSITLGLKSNVYRKRDASNHKILIKGLQHMYSSEIHTQEHFNVLFSPSD